MKNISAALVRAQRAFGPALKTATNPHFRSKYADLSAVVEAVIDGLNSQGIFLTQICHESDTGVTVETQLIHESGETFSAGKLHVPASKQDAQGYGSALTYARRYSLMAACGIAPEDDDGNAAVKSKETKKDSASPSVIAANAAAEVLGVERKSELETLAIDCINHWAANQPSEALSIAHQIQDNESKMYFWALLGTESKLRAYIKAHPKEVEHA